MPGFGLIPARGQWEERWFDVDSTTTFQKGDAVTLSPLYRVRAYASTDSSILGISATSSTASRVLAGGRNQVMVYVPAPKCTAYSDVTTGVAQSDLSVGKKVCLYREGNNVSYTSTVMGHASRFSALATVVGLLDSVNSRVEIAFNMENTAYYSVSSTTYAS